jgi:hypothetical protein
MLKVKRLYLLECHLFGSTLRKVNQIQSIMACGVKFHIYALVNFPLD